MTEKNKFVFILFGLLAGCVSAQPTNFANKKINFESVESLHLGNTLERVKTVLGPPSEVSTDAEGEIEFSYVEPNGHQSAVLGFAKQGQLYMKGYFQHGDAVPLRLVDLEKHLATSSLRSIQPPSCGRDYIKPKILIDRSTGFIIEPYEHDLVQSVFWVSPNRFDELLKSWTECPVSKKLPERTK